ncbi:MAG: hypothetical protein KGR98_09470 [Verrucomicrobia bacterium]|nr:hypothetical protein [Verrucomicrobiota bacterium]MDE3099921.1 hypothetical protein [Verrucomicrobiota bacterium]
MSDDQPKNIWKKSWKGWNWLRAWLIVVLATFLILLVITLPITMPRPTFSGLLLPSVILLADSAVIAAVSVGVWFFIRWLLCRRNIKRSLFGLACLITLIALFYAEEDWRGKHDWEQFKRQWEAKGEHFSFAAVIPPPVPDDQNLAFSPVWMAEIRCFFQGDHKFAETLYGRKIYTPEVSKLLPLMPVSVSGLAGTNWGSVSPNPPAISEGWTTARLTDLKPWQAYYRDLATTNPATEIPITPQPRSPAQDVLLALSKFDPVIEMFRQASLLPDSRFPIDYGRTPPSAILLPHLATVIQVAEVLQLRAIAELRTGRSGKALADVKLMLCLANSVRSEPSVISHLVRIRIFTTALQPIYESLADHKWSDAQLAELNQELAKLNFLAGYETVVRGERALRIANIEFLKHSPRNPHLHAPRWLRLFPRLQALSATMLQSYIQRPPILQTLALGLGPSGWFDQNELRVAQYFAEWWPPIVDQSAKIVSPAKAQAADNAFRHEIQHRTPENLLATWFAPAFVRTARTFAHGQESLDLARVAIALERYRLAHGGYPGSLNALEPDFIESIPHDVIGGRPLHYRRTAGGLFLLYSVGWNETDDSGVVGLGRDGSADFATGDWVWRYPRK